MRIIGITLAFLTAALPLAVRADDAAALLAKHKAYVGWQFGDGTFTSMVMDGDVVKNDGTKTYRLHKIIAGVAKRSQTTDLKRGWTNESGFTGRVYWFSDQNGFTRPELGDVQQFDVAFDVAFNEGATELPGKPDGTAQVDGVSTSIVRVEPKDADPIDLYIDPATGAYKRIVIDPHGTYESSYDILSYTDALPGKKVASKYRVTDSAYTTEWTKITANTALTPADLHPPVPTATWTFADANPFPIKLGPDRIYVDAKVNGVQGHFILDTGDGAGMLLKQEFADRAHVSALGGTTGYGFGGSAKETTIRVKTLEIGGNTLRNLLAVSQQFDYGSFTDADGLLGFDLLAGATVSVDLDKDQMTIQDPATATLDGTKGLLAIVDLSEAIPRLPMKLDGIDVNVELDSGTPDILIYAADMRLKYGLTVLANPNWVMSGIGGYERVSCGTIDTLSAGPIVYRTPSACETRDFSGRSALVGLDFMRHFNWVFDYPHAQLLMIPRHDQ